MTTLITDRNIKITKLEIELLNKIVKAMYAGPDGAVTDFVLCSYKNKKASPSTLSKTYPEYAKLTKSEQGVMTSLLKKGLVEPYKWIYHAKYDITTAAIYPTIKGVHVSIDFFKLVFGNQTTEFRQQFGVDNDLEYLDDLSNWFAHCSQDLDGFTWTFTQLDKSMDEVCLSTNPDNDPEKDKFDQDVEIQINKAFDEVVEAEQKDLKNQSKRTFMWNEETAIEFAAFYANKNKSEFGKFLGSIICEGLTSKKSKIEIFKARWNDFCNSSK